MHATRAAERVSGIVLPGSRLRLRQAPGDAGLRFADVEPLARLKQMEVLGLYRVPWIADADDLATSVFEALRVADPLLRELLSWQLQQCRSRVAVSSVAGAPRAARRAATRRLRNVDHLQLNLAPSACMLLAQQRCNDLVPCPLIKSTFPGKPR